VCTRHPRAGDDQLEGENIELALGKDKSNVISIPVKQSGGTTRIVARKVLGTPHVEGRLENGLALILTTTGSFHEHVENKLMRKLDWQEDQRQTVNVQGNSRHTGEENDRLQDQYPVYITSLYVTDAGTHRIEKTVKHINWIRDCLVAVPCKQELAIVCLNGGFSADFVSMATLAAAMIRRDCSIKYDKQWLDQLKKNYDLAKTDDYQDTGNDSAMVAVFQSVMPLLKQLTCKMWEGLWFSTVV
jgi:hypothetical protein